MVLAHASPPRQKTTPSGLPAGSEQADLVQQEAPATTTLSDSGKGRGTTVQHQRSHVHDPTRLGKTVVAPGGSDNCAHDG